MPSSHVGKHVAWTPGIRPARTQQCAMLQHFILYGIVYQFTSSNSYSEFYFVKDKINKKLSFFLFFSSSVLSKDEEIV